VAVVVGLTDEDGEAPLVSFELHRRPPRWCGRGTIRAAQMPAHTATNPASRLAAAYATATSTWPRHQRRRGVRRARAPRREYRKYPFRDPDLPTELLPVDWIGRSAHAAFVEFREVLRVGAFRHYDRVARLEAPKPVAPTSSRMRRS
jgi:hypothetical protein